MDQQHISIDHRRDTGPVSISAPHEWDGIGQALRSAYRDYREPPADICRMLHDLDALD